MQPNTLWIAEQIPGKNKIVKIKRKNNIKIKGYIESADLTSVLENQKYWPSYNIPYFPYIYNVSGFPQYVEKYGQYFTYNGKITYFLLFILFFIFILILILIYFIFF